MNQKQLENLNHICLKALNKQFYLICIFSVLSKGQGETCRYRFLGKYGGYCWIVSQATIVYDKLKPQSVVCVNYVIRWVSQIQFLVLTLPRGVPISPNWATLAGYSNWAGTMPDICSLHLGGYCLLFFGFYLLIKPSTRGSEILFSCHY